MTPLKLFLVSKAHIQFFLRTKGHLYSAINPGIVQIVLAIDSTSPNLD